MLLKDYVPALKYGAKILSSEVLGDISTFSEKALFVDGDSGSDNNSGSSPTNATKTIQAAVDLASAGDTIYIKALDIAALATDPTSYAESIIIPNNKPQLKLIGVSSGLTQGGVPQIKGDAVATTEIILTVRSAGCLIANLGFNGAGTTGGGILLDSDGGTTKDSFGTTIIGCHFKNCKGTTATDCRTGGAIMWSANGGSWQVRISNNVFYNNVGDVILKGTGVSVPQDVVISDNVFQGIATAVDCHLFLTGGGSGMLGVTVNNNTFADVLPALSSGSIVRYADLTGCTGIFSNNYFGGSYTTSGFGAAKAAAKLPATVGIAHNYSDAGLIVREA